MNYLVATLAVAVLLAMPASTQDLVGTFEGTRSHSIHGCAAVTVTITEVEGSSVSLAWETEGQEGSTRGTLKEGKLEFWRGRIFYSLSLKGDELSGSSQGRTFNAVRLVRKGTGEPPRCP